MLDARAESGPRIRLRFPERTSMSTTPALSLPSAGDAFETTTIERRELRPDDVRIDIHFAGICHTDLHFGHDDMGRSRFPMTPGHEIAGTIAGYFTDVPRPILDAACARYKALGIWNKSPILPRESYERLRDSLVSGAFVSPGVSFERAVDNSLVEAV